MADKTESKKDQLNRLFKENGLIAEDYYAHKHYTIITRSGIEKIQYKNNITIGFEAVKMEPDFCVVKATATKTVGKELVKVETFGSAGHGAKGEADQGKLKTNQYAYYPELAEKRALSRAVLKITNFYELGVFGEDEADDFKKQPEAGKTPQPDPAKLATAKAAMEISSTPPKPLPELQDEFKELMQNDVFTDDEREKALEPLMGYDAAKLTKVIAGTEKLIAKRTTQAA